MKLSRQFLNCVKFMQREDQNGFWVEAIAELNNEDDLIEYEMEMYSTMIDWTNDGLEKDHSVMEMLSYLGRHLHPSMREHS